EEAGLFEADPDPAKPVFTIAIPPPNITGSLHIGHALNHSLQDTIGRFERMRGKSVLIVPGQDHAGIATQSVVAKKLRAEGINPLDLGREAFVQRVWEWRAESGDTILRQFRALGCAYDWNRLQFTLDDHYVDAVLKVFIDWFDRGLIYRSLRVVNWDPILKTTVSDIETERKDIAGTLYHVRYPFADGSGEVIIATTRPETMLADVAVAVHPSDKRYEGLVGRMIRLPLTDREIPLVSDTYPDPEFGTGAVKITPGHDANDFEVGRRCGLPTLILFDDQARITAEGGAYAGLDRVEARKRIVADLREQGFLVREEPHTIPIILSQRSGQPVEPLASEQWFVRQTELAEPARQAIRDGRIRFVPERFGEISLDWLDNIRDWCISRQLWWGHRIPVYYAEDGTPVAATSKEAAEAKLGRPVVRQEEDVLDTWFSSGLWPFVTLGWPDGGEDLKRRYPTTTLVTARDILFLWVARMAMMGLDQAGSHPFDEVIIHATVVNEKGERMSKSLGTGVDPMDVIRESGADALRYALLSQSGQNQALRYGPSRNAEGRAFSNKVWNATRFVLMNLDGYEGRRPESFEPVDRWLLSRLQKTVTKVTHGIESRDFQAACQALTSFFWDDVCDWYIEVVKKTRLRDPDQRFVPQWVLVHSLEVFFRLLHPITPFITDELAAHLPHTDSGFLAARSWPIADPSLIDDEAEAQVDLWFSAARALRALRADLGAAPMKNLQTAFFEGDLRGGEEVVRTQAWFDHLVKTAPSETSVTAVVGGLQLHLPTKGLVEPSVEIARLEKEITKRSVEKEKLDKRLASPAFREKANPEVVARDEEASAMLAGEIQSLSEKLEMFRRLQDQG
ncbi:MAG: valine--tRNA ligase, partial [Fimbriimonadaceae bacterium]|nr:valine--tRNA ligase [Fimbriimonadaceae bacterium]